MFCVLSFLRLMSIRSWGRYSWGLGRLLIKKNTCPFLGRDKSRCCPKKRTRPFSWSVIDPLNSRTPLRPTTFIKSLENLLKNITHAVEKNLGHFFEILTVLRVFSTSTTKNSLLQTKNLEILLFLERHMRAKFFDNFLFLTKDHPKKLGVNVCSRINRPVSGNEKQTLIWIQSP